MQRLFAWLLALGIALPLAGAPSGAGAQGAQDAQFIANLRAHVKHVFIVYQENRSFDSYFGSFPGAENLASPLAQMHGFRQYDPVGEQWVTPFRIGDPDQADADHSRHGLIAKANDGHMDQFVAAEEFRMLAAGASFADARKRGLLTMAYEDCDTIPFLWKYAHTFALYDHIFQAMYGPSTPGNLDLIAAQTGQTQLARHPDEAVAENAAGRGEPVVNDLDPAFGPYEKKPKATQLDQTYANVLLTLEGRDATEAKADSDDVKDDVEALAALAHPAIPWGWYEEGLLAAPDGTHPGYISHHNAPQYFGYIRENAALWSGVHDLTDVFPLIAQGGLPDRSVIFVKGGSHNPFGWKPANPDPTVQAHFLGDDDHPGYSDSQISESLVAKVVNAVARSKYWDSSAIIILWDDSEGFYDHVPPPAFEACPDSHPCGDGPRVPLILISPYAKSGAIVSDPGDHASVAKFLSELFELPPLASLPDEKPYLPQGPRDANGAISNLLGGFDPARLAGTSTPIPASAAEIPDSMVDRFPAAMNCASLGITPVAVPGSQAVPPTGFAPR